MDKGFLRGAAVLATLIATFVLIATPPNAIAETAKIGVARSTTAAPIFIAAEKGFFAAEGIDAQIVFFEAAQPVAVAVVSGDIDFGVTGFTGGFYSMAGQGALKIIAAHSREVPGFRGLGYFVSNHAAEAGLKSYKDLPGHSVAFTTVGSAFHYSLALIAEKYGFDLQSVRIQAVQSNPNAVSAVSGGAADIAMVPSTSGLPAVEHGNAKLMGWVGDETPWQLGAAFITPKTADTRRDLVERFLRAYRKGARLYHDAVTGPDERQLNKPETAEMVAIIAKTIGQGPAEVGAALAYADPDERVDVKDVLHQIAWFRAQGMLKGDFNPEDLMDRRYLIPLPNH
jgi:NitT/TauT family transport system substrate-binding protein